MKIIKSQIKEIFVSAITNHFDKLCDQVLDQYTEDCLLDLKGEIKEYSETLIEEGNKETEIQPADNNLDGLSFTTGSEFGQIGSIDLLVERFCDQNLLENFDTEALAILFKQLFLQLQNHPVVNFNIALQKLETDYISTIFTQESVKGELGSHCKKLLAKIKNYVDTLVSKMPSRDNAVCVKRFRTVNNAYHYQVQHRHNSISFRLKDSAFLFGYSAFCATQNFNQPLLIQLSKGNAIDRNNLIVTFDTTFPNVANKKFDNQTAHTAPVFFQRPVRLEGGQIYTISFDKQREAYIYYGSSVTSNPVAFGEGNNVTFVNATDDEYDNTADVGQFPDLYLY